MSELLAARHLFVPVARSASLARVELPIDALVQPGLA